MGRKKRKAVGNDNSIVDDHKTSKVQVSCPLEKQMSNMTLQTAKVSKLPGLGMLDTQEISQVLVNGTADTQVSKNLAVSMHAVLNTTELVEGILLCLQAREVFVAQRVCRRFRQLVQTSPQIQTKLFMNPSGIERRNWAIYDRTHPWNDSVPSGDFKYVVCADAESPTGNRIRCTPATLSPFLSHNGSHSSRWVYRGQRDGLERVKINLSKGFNTKAPVLQTFLTSPPCQKATVSFGWTVSKHHSFGGIVKFDVSDANGITLGMLLHEAWQKKAKEVWNARTIVQNGAMPDSAIGDVLADMELKYGVTPIIEPGLTEIWLCDTVLPTPKEWDEME